MTPGMCEELKHYMFLLDKIAMRIIKVYTFLVSIMDKIHSFKCLIALNNRQVFIINFRFLHITMNKHLNYCLKD